jgi:hypothetical protein
VTDSAGGKTAAMRQTRQPAGAATPTIALDEKENAPYLPSVAS